MIEATIHDWALVGAALLDGIAALVVVAAALEAAGTALAAVARPHVPSRLLPIRRRLSEWLSLALELLIAGDIVRTAVSPSWPELGRLAAIVVVRIIINFTLRDEAASG